MADNALARFDIVIVGGGHAGAQTATALRQRGFSGSIGLIGEEPEPPYERPPLSKDYLAGKKTFERILIRPESFWAEKSIALRLGQAVVAVDPAGHVVTLADGARLGYGALVWATGGAPRRLSCAGHDLRGVHSVRTRADVDRMIEELPFVSRVIVIGGGYIGLEAAAVLTKLGKSVTVLEALDRVLARVTGEPLSRFFEAEHRAHGVDIRLKISVDCIVGVDGRASGVQVDGLLLPADMVIVGIGIVPAIQPLLDAGAAGGNGVLIDAFCRTSLAGIYAVGDCAAHANPFADDALIRLESVQNANDQAATVARTLTGAPKPYRAVPWFWSNQFDVRLQTVGLSAGHDQIVQRGDVASGSFSLIYLKAGRVIALDCVNAVKDYVQGRALVIAHASPPTDLLSDIGTPLKALVPAP